MPKTILAALFLSLLMIGGGPVFAQGPQEDVKQDSPEAEAAPQPEVPKQISTVIIEGNRLSIEFVNVSFGEILQSLSQKAGFQLEGSSSVFSKKVTTKFTDLDIDKGIIRLFSLVKESNYLISYDSKGAVSKLRVSSLGAPLNTPPPQTRAPGLRRGRQIPQPKVPQPASPQPEEDTGNEEAPPDE